MRNFLVLIGLCLIAGIGRAIQLGAIGEVTVSVNIILEMLIQGARICVFLFALRQGSMSEGVQRIRKIFLVIKDRHLLKSVQKTIVSNFRENKIPILINFVVFIIIAVLANYLIDVVAYNTGLLTMLKESGMIHEKSSEWAVLLFFKNLSVIPFTIIFETIFFLWLLNRLRTGTVINFKTSNQ